jgi:Ran GTPase-activating protein (RanGAP) involved in mRNA processing and transport
MRCASASTPSAARSMFGALPDELVGQIIALAQMEALPVLSRLERRCNRLGTSRLRALARLQMQPFGLDWRAIVDTRELYLGHDELGTVGATVFAQACARGLGQLTGLYLGSHQIGDGGVVALADACGKGAMAQLRSLELRANGIGGAGCIALAEACGHGALARLRHLWLDKNRIDDAGMEALSSAFAAGALARLSELYLGMNVIGDQGLVAFADACASGAMPRLQHLGLGPNLFGEAGVKGLARAVTSDRDGELALAQLKTLRLYGTRISADGADALAVACAIGGLPALAKIIIDEPSVSLTATCLQRGIRIRVFVPFLNLWSM